MNTLLRTLLLSTAIFLSAPTYCLSNNQNFQPRTDEREYIDVWKLLHDIQLIPEDLSHNEFYGCFDDTYPPDMDESDFTQFKFENYPQAIRSCIKKSQQHRTTYLNTIKSFNKVWLPVLMNAVSKGDPVAEIILRKCEITPVIDRRQIESTCSPVESARKVAQKRVMEIHFVPAIDYPKQEFSNDCPNEYECMKSYKLSDTQELELVKHGKIDYLTPISRPYAGYSGGFYVKFEVEALHQRRSAVVDAIVADIPRTFTLPGIPLSLHRKHMLPDQLTWGRTGQNWRSDSQTWAIVRADKNKGGVHEKNDIRVGISGKGVKEFETLRLTLIKDIELNLQKFLQQDPRWGVFLLNRIGHNEWLPNGLNSNTHRIREPLAGKWVLEKYTDDWRKPMHPLYAIAEIKQENEHTHITIEAKESDDPHANTNEPFSNVKNCLLRYSGGSTIIPELGTNGQKPDKTLFGDMHGKMYEEGENKEAVAPFNPRKKYRQILMQCEKAESPESDRTRFLFYTGKYLVEVGKRYPNDPISIRHYRRMK